MVNWTLVQRLSRRYAGGKSKRLLTPDEQNDLIDALQDILIMLQYFGNGEITRKQASEHFSQAHGWRYE